MNIEQIYLQFLQIVNRNITDDNVNIDKSKFILLFNSVQNRYVDWILKKRNNDSIRDVEQLLELDKPLQFNADVLNHSDFKLPKNYFNHSSIQVFGSKNKCLKQKLEAFEVTNDNVETYLIDINNKPSFKYRETFYTINNSKISIYKDNFKIDKVFLSYYRKPVQVDIKGYININNTPSINIDPEFSDRIVQVILIAMAKEFSSNNGNSTQYQIEQDKLFKQI